MEDGAGTGRTGTSRGRLIKPETKQRVIDYLGNPSAAALPSHWKAHWETHWEAHWEAKIMNPKLESSSPFDTSYQIVMNDPTRGPIRRRTSKCVECPYKDAKPSQRSRDELAYARCTPPEDFHCHMGHEHENWSGSYGYGDGETICRGHWEMHHAAVKRGIEADKSAGGRVFGDDSNMENDDAPPSE